MSKKQERSQQEIEAEIQAIYTELKAKVDEGIKSKNYVQALKVAISKPPYDSKNAELVASYVFLVQSVLAQVNLDNTETELIQELTRDELRTLFDYVNKSLEYISNGKPQGPYSTKINSNYLLKLFSIFTQNRSKSIILLGIGNSKSLVTRLDKWTP